MWDKIFTYLGDKYPILLIFCALIYISWKIFALYTRFVNTEKTTKELKSELSSLNNTVNNGFSNVKDAINSFSKEMHGVVDSVKNEINSIKIDVAVLKQAEYAKPHYNQLSSKNSPKDLTEFGKQILADFSGIDFLENNYETLERYVLERNHATALDVEENALDILRVHSNDPMFNDVKVRIYNAPKYKLPSNGNDYELTLWDYMLILHIPLRDMILNKHPEIKK